MSKHEKMVSSLNSRLRIVLSMDTISTTDDALQLPTQVYLCLLLGYDRLYNLKKFKTVSQTLLGNTYL